MLEQRIIPNNSNFDLQVSQLLQSKNYSSLSKYCEEVLDHDFHVPALIYLGIAKLLLGAEEEGQLVWMMGISELETESQVAEFEGELIKQLKKTSKDLEQKHDFHNTWLLRQHIRSINPSDLENHFGLLWCSIWIGSLEPEILEETNHLINKHQLQNHTKTVALMNEYIPKFLYSGLLDAITVIRSCSEWLLNQPDYAIYINKISNAAAHAAYKNKNCKFAITLTKLGLELKSNDSFLLSYLPRFCMLAKQYGEAIEAAQEFLQHAKQNGHEIIPLSILLQAYLVAGAWDELDKISRDYRTKLKHTLESSEQLSLSASKIILVSTGNLSYLQDTPRENRSLQNQVGKILTQNTNKLLPDRSIPILKPKAEGEKIRIGYIGHTFRIHSVGWLCRWLFKYHDQDKFEISIFLVNTRPDNHFFQSWFQNRVDHVVECIGNETEVYQQIQDKDIEILVDVDCITYDMTCSVMSLKPAPIQVSWLGWDASGLDSIDYFLADHYVVPEEAQEYYQEKLYRLPACYLSVDGFECDIPTIKKSDFDVPEDSIVFLTAQTGMKRHPKTLRMQLKIVKQTPNSYLFIKGWSDQERLQKVIETIALEEGVSLNRIKHLPMVANEYIHRANLRIADVVLDTYPYNGATTTLETLWMEIPIVTRVGKQFAARNSYTFMKHAGLDEGIAFSEEEYIEWGVKFGTDPNLRAKVMQKLRASKQTSPLWNAKNFTRQVEDAYQNMLSHHQDKSILQNCTPMGNSDDA